MKKLAINPSNKKYYSDDYIKGWEDGVKAQYEATKDAVEVVRCVNCVFYEKASSVQGFCISHESIVYINDFCSFAVRREP